MKKIVATILYLLLFVGISAAALGLSAARDRYDVGDAWGKVEWVGEQIAKPSRAYDYVFIGSSHIWNAIDAPRVSRELSDLPDGAVNLGMNWFGRDRDWIFARDFLRRHRVKNLVIECSWEEASNSHDYFKYLATPLDVFRHPITVRLASLQSFRWGLGQAKSDAIFVMSRLADVGIGIYVRTLRRLHGVRRKAPRADFWDAHLGYLPNGTSAKDAATWRAQQAFFTAPPGLSPQAPANVPGERFAYEELRRIADECRRLGVRLIFLFVPHRFNWELNPARRRSLESLGAAVIPFPRELLVDPGYWTDDGHITIDGANLFTGYFIAQEKARAAGRPAT
jgi:hypothetical protein